MAQQRVVKQRRQGRTNDSKREVLGTYWVLFRHDSKQRMRTRVFGTRPVRCYGCLSLSTSPDLSGLVSDYNIASNPFCQTLNIDQGWPKSKSIYPIFVLTEGQLGSTGCCEQGFIQKGLDAGVLVNLQRGPETAPSIARSVFCCK